MPRQNFLSRESFVNASELKTRDSIMSLPFHLGHIELITENKMIDKMRFVYVHAAKKIEYFIDVTVLPLNEQYTRVSLHASHVNGHSFYEDAEMAIALHDFESAIHATVNGDLAALKATGFGTVKEKKPRGHLLLKYFFPHIELNKKFS
jgi:hypothetical protein